MWEYSWRPTVRVVHDADVKDEEGVEGRLREFLHLRGQRGRQPTFFTDMAPKPRQMNTPINTQALSPLCFSDLLGCEPLPPALPGKSLAQMEMDRSSPGLPLDMESSGELSSMFLDGSLPGDIAPLDDFNIWMQQWGLQHA